MSIPDEVLKAAKQAVLAPAPSKIKSPLHSNTRENWRKQHNELFLPSEHLINVDNVHGWKLWSPFEIDGKLKPTQELNRLADKLSVWKEAGYLLHDKKTGEIVGVVLDGSTRDAPYIAIGIDKPGMKFSIVNNAITFPKDVVIQGMDGGFVSSIPVRQAEITLRGHNKGVCCEADPFVKLERLGTTLPTITRPVSTGGKGR